MEQINKFESTHKAVLFEQEFMVDKMTPKQPVAFVARKSTGGRAPRKARKKQILKTMQGRIIGETEKKIFPPYPPSLLKAFQELITLCISGNADLLSQYLKEENNSDHVKCLLMSGAKDISTGYNAYEFASIQGHRKVLECLLEIEDKKGVLGRAAEFAIMMDHEDIIIGHGNGRYYLTTSSDNENKELYFALKYKSKKTLLSFQLNNIDVNGLDQTTGYSALHLFCREGEIGKVVWLMQTDIDVNICSQKEELTPLHLASENGHIEVVKSLLGYNANVFKQNKNGLDPLEYVKDHIEKSPHLKKELLANIMKIIDILTNRKKWEIENINSNYEAILESSSIMKQLGIDTSVR